MEHIDDASIMTPNPQQSFPPKTWLVESVLVTVFCCQILGIIGIINAASVESKFYRGDVLGAQKASKLAKQMVIWSVISWFIIIGIVVIFYIFVFVLAATTGEWK
ncbi:CD225/dispanin family protein [Elizabethkingia sp. HX WHF]|uniref:CD225/dispanin family protein n=1 Tax=Elizabethkingia bruuniana TaxID=1756149 RepID=A0A7T7V2Q8_9FLAO|nr:MULTISPECIES: CD225/dispanin family protein [Elizabethkingia]AJW64304.1 Interferon-induced transmembrane protein [Elizabethkingia miricola]AQX86908.1 hypothetical protein AYC65_18675 [Elizabethkingia bruuniana]ATL44310.1 hypothetical protein CQS02_13895 [Elizabethkingia miricola]KGO08288.1 hypothetical protein KS04_20905 [Elizabethkingia miricola]KUY26856.1 hypothetical protein ATB97_04975 [Elizabethkingia bruuniana]